MALDIKIKKHLPAFDLDIEFTAGAEAIGFLGASGCGKSLTLRCIAGVETPDEGHIIVNGKTFFDSNLSTIEIDGVVQHLSARQSEILTILAQNIGQTVERGIILQSVWGNDSYANSLALNVQITYLRKMLEADTSISIVSLKKRGYVLEVK